MVELIALLAILGILAGVAITALIPTQHQVIDRGGPTLIATAALDARATAAANSYAYDTTPGALAAAMNSYQRDRATTNLEVTYTTGPATAPEFSDNHGTLNLSVAAPEPTTAAFATLTSTTPAGGRCLLAVDNLRTGTQYSQLTTTSDDGCTAHVAAACAQIWATLPGSGTAQDPHQIPADHTCTTAT